jgi:hypothetical protein
MADNEDIADAAEVDGTVEKETPPEDGTLAEGNEATPEAGTLSESEKKLANMEKRLADTEAAFKERQREFYEFVKSSGATEAQLKQLMEAQSKEKETDPLDDPNVDEQLSTDPLFVKKLIRESGASLKRELAKLLQDRDAYFLDRENRVREMVMESSPTMAKYKAARDELKKQSWFGALSQDDQQAAIKAFAAAKPERTPDTISPVSGRRPPKVAGEPVNEEAEALAALYGLTGEPKDPRIIL